MTRRPEFARTLPWLALLAVGGAAAWLRYGLIQPGHIAALCGDAGSPWWCPLRQWLVLGFLDDVYGVLALVVAAWALFSRRRAVAWLAAALGLFALELYCYQAGALALLAGCLRLLRLQARLSPIVQYRPGQREVQHQP
ncbi:MAG: hypothetical protein ABI379_13395 [Rhodanobacter sp.]